MDYTTATYEDVSVERDADGVVLLTLRNGDNMNAMTLKMFEEVGEIIPQIAADPAARAVVLTGEGRAFSAGGNMHALTDEKVAGDEGPLTRPLWNTRNLPAAERLKNTQTTGLRMMRQIYELEKPVVAAINGPAAGAGMDLALWCDVRVMSSETFMIHSYTRVGMVPFDGGMWLLPRIVGLGRAMEIMYGGDKIFAEQALDWGLVNRVVPAEETLEAAMEWARKLAHGPSMAYGLIKYITHQCMSMDAIEALDLSYVTRDVVFSSDDHHEGVKAFFERRPPEFQGR